MSPSLAKRMAEEECQYQISVFSFSLHPREFEEFGEILTTYGKPSTMPTNLPSNIDYILVVGIVPPVV